MCYFEHIYFTDFALKVLLSGLYCHEPSLPTLKVDWLKIVLPLVASSWQYQQKAARQVFKNLQPILCLSQEIGFMKQLRLWLWLWLFFLFMSFTAPFVCESHHLRFNRRVPQKAVLFHVLAAFRLVALLYYKLISLLWDDGTHLRFCFTSLPLRTTAAMHIRAHPRATHVCAPLLRLPLTVWPHSELTWLVGFHPCSAPSEASLSPLSPVWAPCWGHATGVALCWMTEQPASKLLWAKRNGSWAQNTSK